MSIRGYEKWYLLSTLKKEKGSCGNPGQRQKLEREEEQLGVVWRGGGGGGSRQRPDK